MLFVVDTWEDGIRMQPKVFEAAPAARSYATQEVQDGKTSKVYRVPNVSDVRAAIAALEMNEAELDYAPTRKFSEKEIEDERKRQAWEDFKSL